jgi:hypothetical protein
MALTGTPLINDIEDFLAIWQFLGWIDGTKPRAELMDALADTGLTPADPGSTPPPAVRRRPRHRPPPQGRRRRRHPARRIADLPVELDGPPAARSGAAERDLARRMVARYSDAPRRPPAPGSVVEGVDHGPGAPGRRWREQKDATSTSAGRQRLQR